MEIIKNHYSVIDNFDFSANVLKPDVIINGMKMKEDFRIVKKKYFNIKELYSRFDLNYKDSNVDLKEAITESDFGHKLYRIPTKSELKDIPHFIINNEERYKDNQLVFGSDITYR